MSLIDKFSSIEIKTDRRISEEDKAFCLRQQEAFDKSGIILRQIGDILLAGCEEQKQILGCCDSKKTNYLSGFERKCNVSQTLEAHNIDFIRNIVAYFEEKYVVKLDVAEVKAHLIPDFSKKNGDIEKIEQYKTLSLRYEQILDEIFAQLEDGFSLQEQAMKQMLERCWNASHNYQTNENFEVKKDTLKLVGCWCRYDTCWDKWIVHEGLRTILNAIVHFQYGLMNKGHLYFLELFSYCVNQNEFPINNIEKIKNIKLYKNGRVDIKFKNSDYLQKFVEKYLRNRGDTIIGENFKQ